MAIGNVERCGFQRLTGSGVIGDAGKAIIVQGYSVDSGAAAATPSILNGATAGAPVAWKAETTPLGTTGEQNVSMGRMLPFGCFVLFDAGTVAITVFYVQDQS